jgi:hypothetical protein
MDEILHMLWMEYSTCYGWNDTYGWMKCYTCNGWNDTYGWMEYYTCNGWNALLVMDGLEFCRNVAIFYPKKFLEKLRFFFFQKKKRQNF